jgi:hypothetical protein
MSRNNALTFFAVILEVSFELMLFVLFYAQSVEVEVVSKIWRLLMILRSSFLLLFCVTSCLIFTLFLVVSLLFLDRSSLFTLCLDFFHFLSTLFWCYFTCKFLFLFLFLKVCHGYLFLSTVF